MAFEASRALPGTLVGRIITAAMRALRLTTLAVGAPTIVGVVHGCGGRTGLLDALSSAPDQSSATTESASSALSSGSGSSAFSASGSTSSSFTTGSAASGPLSCQPGGPGMTNCGPRGRGTETCCLSPEAMGGTFRRTYNNSGFGPTDEADPATVSSFRLDKYLVTVGRFRQFVTAWSGGTGYTPPAGSGKHMHLNGGLGLAATGGGYEPGWVVWDQSNIAPTNTHLVCDPSYATWTNSLGASENLPINCVNWYEAYAFCIWDGGFLPSEAEWEYAAAGGNQQREYPWGSTDPGSGNQYAIYGCEYPSSTGNCSGVTNVAPVGSPTLGASLWGQLDLGGDMLEWALDWFATSYVDPCTDCANLSEAFSRVLRGGYFQDGSSRLLPPYRGYNGPPTSRNYAIGVRCSRTP